MERFLLLESLPYIFFKRAPNWGGSANEELYKEMKKQSLAGIWKLRPEFLDVTADQWQQVLRHGENPPEAFGQKMYVLKRGGDHAFPIRGGFMQANVPCDVITPLMENGVIEEPFLKDNTKDIMWIRNLSWWFVKDFTVDSELLAQEEVRLFIEMLDYKADIMVNGIPVAQHKNTFVPFYEDIKRFLHEGENQIIIRLTSGVEDYYDRDSVSFYCDSSFAVHDQRIYLRKPQFTYGWDWCKPVPTCGIGRNIYLEGVSGARISAFRADTLSISEEKAELDLFFEIENLRLYSADDTVLEYTIRRNGKIVAQGKRELYLCGGLNFIHEPCTIENPELWWPNGYGDPNLYDVEAHVVCRGAQNEMKPCRIGIRTIKVSHAKLEDGTREYVFIVNGVRVWCKGGNWVPTDSVYLRTPESTYRTLVEEAKAMHFTMLRMWGGGTYEPDCFYEYCSENGILLMHDFMYACAFYPDHLDWFLHQAELEADYQTKRLAHYPCMAIWTGNNEIHESYTDWFPEDIRPDRLAGAKIFNYVQPTMVHKNSPLIPYAPSSPFFAEHANDQDAGDSHVWKWVSRFDDTKMKFHYELEAFDRLTTRFSSEYGFQGALMRSSVERFHAGEPIDMESDIWVHHGEHEGKRKTILEGIGNHMRDTEGLTVDEYLLYSGMMHGSLYRDMAETLRAKPYCHGDLMWMYNDCWPETGWTPIDYYLTRKVSFYYVKRAFAERKMIWKVLDGQAVLTVINETPEDCTWEIEYGFMGFDGEVKEKHMLTVQAGAHSWQQPVAMPSGYTMQDGFWYAKAEGLETATSVRPYYRDLPLPKAKAEIISAQKDGDDMLVTVRAESYVPVVCLLCSDDRTHLSDNYFEMLPGAEKTVRVENCSECPKLLCPVFEPKKS